MSSAEHKPHSELFESARFYIDRAIKARLPLQDYAAALEVLERIEEQLEAEKKWGRNQADLLTDCATENERLKEQLEALRKLEATLRSGWPKSVLVDRDGADEEMLAFPLSAWWPVRDALAAALDSNPAKERE